MSSFSHHPSRALVTRGPFHSHSDLALGPWTLRVTSQPICHGTHLHVCWRTGGPFDCQPAMCCGNGEPFQPLGGPFHLSAPNPPASWCSGVPYSLHMYWGHRRVGALGALACPLAVESRALSATIFPPAVSPGPLLPLSVPQSVLCAGDLGETSGHQPTTQ